ncbi:MAG TPA: type II toxin-antitoxin system VapC family toxin [Burkholderiaceae bacterium]|nr:type II toxin-antitoxin system VapC family toxin [Burkholderiaceae bacterium]
MTAPVRPSAVVIDASVTATWLLPDERSESAERVYVRVRLGEIELHAPELWLWECGNIIANSVKRSRMTPADAMLTWSVLDAVRSRVDLASPEPAQVRAALTLALDHALSLYDAAYLWLARSLKLPLLTHDRQLAAAAGSTVRVVTLEDLV